MTFRPTSDNTKEKVFFAVSAILCVLLFVLSSVVSRFVGLYQISAIIMAVVSIEIFMKFVASDYVYEATDESLKIHKITGKKSICVASLDYNNSYSLVMTGDEYKKNKEKYPKITYNINYTKNINPRKFFVYIFDFNTKNVLLKFEPDDEFCDYVNQRIKNIKIDI